ITLETKPFRESIGFQLPEENLQIISKSNKNDVIDFTNTPDPLTATSNATHDNDFIINPLKRKHSSGGIDQRNIPAGSNLKSDDQPIRLDDNLSSSPSSSSSPSNDYESKAKKACFRTTTSPNSSVGKPSSLPPLPTSTSGELHTPTLTDKDSPDILLSSAIEKSDCQVSDLCYRLDCILSCYSDSNSNNNLRGLTLIVEMWYIEKRHSTVS
ncbi:unnamed protein product, partial [Trichobilharzia regenti]